MPASFSKPSYKKGTPNSNMPEFNHCTLYKLVSIVNEASVCSLNSWRSFLQLSSSLDIAEIIFLISSPIFRFSSLLRRASSLSWLHSSRSMDTAELPIGTSVAGAAVLTTECAYGNWPWVDDLGLCNRPWVDGLTLGVCNWPWEGALTLGVWIDGLNWPWAGDLTRKTVRGKRYRTSRPHCHCCPLLHHTEYLWWKTSININSVPAL